MSIYDAFTDNQWLKNLIILIMMNTHESYDIPNDFPNHKHEQNGYAKKVIYHSFSYIAKYANF